jgi:6-phosphogluconolactonase
MIKTRGTVLTLVAVLAAIGACESKGDDSGSDEKSGSANGGVGAPGGGASGHPAAGIGGGGASAGTNSEAGETSNAGDTGAPSAGMGGLGDTVGSGGGGGGTTNASGSGGEAVVDGGAAGETGIPVATRPEYAYLSTVLSGIFAFSIDPVSGKLDPLPGSPVDTTAQVYSVSVDPEQRHLYVLDLVHELDVFTINADGSLPMTPSSSTPIEGSPVTLALDPEGRFAYVGTRTDEQKTFIQAFKITAGTGALTSSGDSLELGGAPAYVAVDPTGRFAYVTESTGFGIWGYTIDQTTGLLSPIITQSFGGNAVFGGAVALRPDGKFLYTTGNGLNGFAIDPVSGALQLINTTPFNTDVSSDPTATNVAMDPRGEFLYATEFVGNSRIFGFSIDDASGMLTAVPGQSTAVSMPYSVGVEPSGRFAYSGRDDGKVSAFAVNRADGTLREIDGSPIDQGGLQPEIAFARSVSH